MKKFFSLVLALVMALSLTTVAWGADPVPVTSTADLQAAINRGDTKIVLGEGEFTADFYDGTPNRNLTITGQGAATKLNFANLQVRLALFDSLTIENCTIGRMLGKSWGQLVFGSSTQAGGVYTISNCIFDDEGTQGIYINQDVAATFNIVNCTFKGDFGDEGAIVVQNNSVPAIVNVSDNNFSVTKGEKIAIHYHKDQLILNADVDETVLIKAGDGGTAAENFERAVATADAGDTFKLMENVDLTTLSNPVEITDPINIDDNDKTLTGLAAGSNITTDDNGKITGGTFADPAAAAPYLADGLELTADGVVVSEGGAVLGTKYDMVTTDIAATKTVGVTVNTFKANKPKDTNKDGLLDQPGNVKYVEFSNMPGVAFVQVNTAGEADYAVYQTGTKSLFGYFKFVGSPEYFGDGVAFFDFGENCGQYDETPEVGAKYYLFQGVLFQAVDPDEVAPDGNLMVGSALTPVVALSDEFVDHSPVFTYDKDYKVVAVKCGECGTPAVLYANFASVPKADKADAVALGDGQWYVWLEGPGAVVDTETKVESADTFDAGIAMYVGMSVMAAAGSAVVIGKKKD